MLTSKSIKLLKFLLDKKDKTSLKELAEHFNLSERSIRYEVEKIQEEIEKENFKIILNKGEYLIEGYSYLEKFLENNTGYVPSPKERELYIFLKICFERVINQTIISNELEISKSTIKTHLRDIRKSLEMYNLELDLFPKKGLIIKGDEEQLRQCTLKAIYFSKKQKSKFLDDVIAGYLKIVDEEGLKLFINYCQKLMDKIVSDEAYEIILKYLTIVIYFNRKDCMIKSIKNENFLKSTFKYWFAHWNAYQMTALNLGCWKMKYLFHDAEKPWLLKFWKDYKRVRNWHRHNNNHHLAYKDIDNIDWEALVLDWECSRFTKQDSPRTAREMFNEYVKKYENNEEIGDWSELKKYKNEKGNYDISLSKTPTKDIAKYFELKDRDAKLIALMKKNIPNILVKLGL